MEELETKFWHTLNRLADGVEEHIRYAYHPTSEYVGCNPAEEWMVLSLDVGFDFYTCNRDLFNDMVENEEI